MDLCIVAARRGMREAEQRGEPVLDGWETINVVVWQTIGIVLDLVRYEPEWLAAQPLLCDDPVGARHLTELVPVSREGVPLDD